MEETTYICNICKCNMKHSDMANGNLCKECNFKYGGGK